MTFHNHYAVLGVSRDATPADIKSAYNKLALAHHPEKGGSSQIFLQVQSAWELLREEKARQKFDSRNPFANGVPGKPQFATSKSTSDTQKSEPTTRANSKPTANAWGDYRESAGGNAYHSWNTTDDGSPRPRKQRARHPSPRRPRRESPRRGSTHRDRDSPPPQNARSPSPEAAEVPDVSIVQALADKASSTVRRYKKVLINLRAGTSMQPIARLSQEINLKMEHVSSYLIIRELSLKLRLHKLLKYNSDVEAKVPTATQDPFFSTLEETILSHDIDNVTDLDCAMERVLNDAKEMLRVKKALETKNLVITDNQPAVRNWKSSTAALERLLMKVLLKTPGVGPPQGHGY